MTKKFLLSTSLLLMSACAVGPDYEKAPVETPDAFKEIGTWDKAVPQDEIDRGQWWTVYGDPVLNDLEGQIDISNQNLKQAEANFRAAVALAGETRAGLFPLVSFDASGTRSGNGGGTTTGLGSATTTTGTTTLPTTGTGFSSGRRAVTTYDLSADGSWVIDIWGRIRRQLESDEANAEASAADLASARLSAQAELATDYYALRVEDQLQRLLVQTVSDDQKILTIVENQYKVGVAAQSDVLLAQTTMESAQASATDTGIKRAQLEHAIAVLVGKAPSDFALAPTQTIGDVPIIPATLPSDLLQRRPDIAAAERQMAAANAEIGVAEAAYFPQLELDASYGYGASQLGKLIKTGSNVWSFGADASDNIIDFGYRDSATDNARATYDASVAFYRQTVLTAFQNVEDNLAAQRILVVEEKQQNQATADARKSEQISLNQYKEGIIPYNNVLTAQVTTLLNEESSLTVLNSRLSASVALVEATGGGWKVQQLPDVSGPLIPNPL